MISISICFLNVGNYIIYKEFSKTFISLKLYLNEIISYFYLYYIYQDIAELLLKKESKKARIISTLKTFIFY